MFIKVSTTGQLSIPYIPGPCPLMYHYISLFPMPTKPSPTLDHLLLLDLFCHLLSLLMTLTISHWFPPWWMNLKCLAAFQLDDSSLANFHAKHWGCQRNHKYLKASCFELFQQIFVYLHWMWNRNLMKRVVQKLSCKDLALHCFSWQRHCWNDWQVQVQLHLLCN